MNRIVIFLVIVYVISGFGAWALLSKNTGTNTNLAEELVSVKAELVAVKSLLETEKAQRALLEKKISDARVNAAFLSLALCPTLEATDKDALCMNNSTEWLSQTILAGMTLPSTEAKAKMELLLVALGAKTKPTSKQLYDMLRPIEVESLRTLAENLK